MGNVKERGCLGDHPHVAERSAPQASCSVGERWGEVAGSAQRFLTATGTKSLEGPVFPRAIVPLIYSGCNVFGGMPGTNMADDKLRSESESRAALSIDEAARILGVPGEFFIELLNNGQIPYHRAGTHRQISLRDVIAYRDRRDRRRHEAVNQMAKDAMQAGHCDEF